MSVVPTKPTETEETEEEFPEEPEPAPGKIEKDILESVPATMKYIESALTGKEVKS